MIYYLFNINELIGKKGIGSIIQIYKKDYMSKKKLLYLKFLKLQTRNLVINKNKQTKFEAKIIKSNLLMLKYVIDRKRKRINFKKFHYCDY